MMPIYKQVKELKPFCPKCKERLVGDGSFTFPYKCSCGIWTYELKDNSLGEYEIAKTYETN